MRQLESFRNLETQTKLFYRFIFLNAFSNGIFYLNKLHELNWSTTTENNIEIFKRLKRKKYILKTSKWAPLMLNFFLTSIQLLKPFC